MNEYLFEVIAKEFCGDEDSQYEYKSGPQLVDFFNINFGYNDQYYSGFPTRWRYASERIQHIQHRNLINEFFTLIMSLEFHIQEKNLTAVEAVPFISSLMKHWNKLLRPFRYQLIKIADRYELTNFDENMKLIGSGGFADVFVEKSTGLVLKRLKRENLVDRGSIHRFKREYEITKTLSDVKGIIEVYDFNDSEYYYVMEKCDCTLLDFLTNNPLGISSKEAIIDQILGIMSVVHQRNIIHRDISSNNIFLKGSEIKIADFGLGKDFDFVLSHQTKSTAQLGQIQYCPPEQLMKLGDTGKYSDVYSLGRLVNFIMTNNPNDKDHKYKLLVEKATSLEANNRYIDAVVMYENFKKIKEYTESREKLEYVTNLIKSEKYDENVELYISSLSSQSLCDNIISMQGFRETIYTYFENNEESVLEILEFIKKDMDNSCRRFEDADNFADVAHYVLENNLGTFVVKERAAEILNHVAYYVNRFYAQRLIESLVNRGIEPMLEDILIKR